MDSIGDLKKYLMLDEEKICKSLFKEGGLKLLAEISNDKEFWKRYFIYNEAISSLENFLRYRAAVKFNLYKKGYDDSDITKPVMDHFKKVLKDIPHVVCIEVGKEIAEDEKDRTIRIRLDDGEIIYFETDTAISLMGDLGIFMKKIIKKIEGLSYNAYWPKETYMKNYNLPCNKSDKFYIPYKLFYFAELQKRIRNGLTTEIEINCYKTILERGKYVHRLENMMLVPYGYNAPRGFRLSTYKSKKRIADRLDLTMVDYLEMLADSTMTDEKFQNRLNLKVHKEYTTLRAVQFIVENKEKLMPKVPIFTGEGENETLNGVLIRNQAINCTYI